MNRHFREKKTTQVNLIVSHPLLFISQEIVDKDGNGKLFSFLIPSLSKPSIYHEVKNSSHLHLLLNLRTEGCSSLHTTVTPRTSIVLYYCITYYILLHIIANGRHTVKHKFHLGQPYIMYIYKKQYLWIL